MALVYRNSDSLRNPPSPSLTNPDMILPYDPRLRDSTSTTQSGHSGPDITSLNDQMAMSLSTTRAINRGEWEPGGDKSAKRQSMPGEWNETNDQEPSSSATPANASAHLREPPARGIRQGTTGGANVFKSGTSFLNLSRFSTISTTAKSDGSNGIAPVEEEDEGEVAARNDFARAEEILANAKKRLTAMEGNLTRARSISVSRSASVASNVPDDTSFSGRLHGGQPRQNGWAISAAKLRGSNWAPAGQSSNHTRVFSENSIPNQNLSLVDRVNDGERGHTHVRSSSAMGSIHGEDRSPNHDPYGGYRSGFGRLEPLQEDELLSPASDSSRANSYGLDRFSELSAKARSNVQLRDLREQMQDLKGKLDVLKRRTREDSLHRRSMQYLKSPSPFTDAEAWRSTPPRNGSRQSTRRSEDTPRPGDSPQATRSTPTRQMVSASPVHDQEPLSSPGSMSGGPRGVIDGALTSLDEKLATSGPSSPQRRVSHRPNLSGSLAFPTNVVERSAFDPWSPQSEKAEILNIEDEDAKEAAKAAQEKEVVKVESARAESTSQEESSKDPQTSSAPATSQPTTTTSQPTSSSDPSASDSAEVSHEDRPDAFDYENFILSSTMGTYMQRSQSSSSTSTIGPEAYLDADPSSPVGPPSSPPMLQHHMRNPSAGSTSSLDTFATANSRAASRLQAGSRQQIHGLREAASRDAMHNMPGAFVYSHAPTPVPGQVDEENEARRSLEQETQRPSSRHIAHQLATSASPTSPTSPSKRNYLDTDRDRDRDSASTPRALPRDRFSSTSTISERPLSIASASSFSRPRPPSTLYTGSNATYSIASTTASVFSTSMAAPAIDPAGDPAAIAARGQIMRLLLANPLQGGDAHVRADDERLVTEVVMGLQRQCGALVWVGAVHGQNGGDRMGLGDVRRRLAAAKKDLEIPEAVDAEDAGAQQLHGNRDGGVSRERGQAHAVAELSGDNQADADAANSVDDDADGDGEGEGGERFVAL